MSDTRGPATPVAEEPRRARVLVVDDNRDLVESLSAVLTMLGHDADGVTSGTAALHRMQTWTPDLVLMDVTMPELSGYETAQRVRREGWGASMFLIAMTGLGRDEDRQQALDAGFDWFVSKPLDVDGIRTLLAGFDTSSR